MGPGFNQVQPQYRLGDPTKVPAIDSKYEVYNPNVSTAMKIYAFIIGTHANILFEAAQVHICYSFKQNHLFLSSGLTLKQLISLL